MREFNLPPLVKRSLLAVYRPPQKLVLESAPEQDETTIQL